MIGLNWAILRKQGRFIPREEMQRDALANVHPPEWKHKIKDGFFSFSGGKHHGRKKPKKEKKEKKNG
jgi:hypothetical protein